MLEISTNVWLAGVTGLGSWGNREHMKRNVISLLVVLLFSVTVATAIRGQTTVPIRRKPRRWRQPRSTICRHGMKQRHGCWLTRGRQGHRIVPRRATNCILSSITEHSFHGITPPLEKREKCNLCVRYDVLPMSRAAHNHLRLSKSFTSFQISGAVNGFTMKQR